MTPLAGLVSSSRHTFGGDRSLALRSEGYQFWSNLRESQGSEIVRARLLHERVTCIRGAEAARFFYEEPRLKRSSALPGPIVRSLFGRGAVHTLDGTQHAHRKGMFTDLLPVEAVNDIVSGVAHRWDEESATWSGTVDVFDEVSPMLLAAACEWLGLPVRDGTAARRAADMVALVDGFGSPGLRHLRANRARRRTERWVQGFIQDIRDGASSDTPIGRVALHRDEHGNLLPVRTAAVEAINLIRPTVAISWLVSGVVLAFDSWPRLRDELARDSFRPLDVAQEVRRCYPFVPFLGARATKRLEWSGVRIPKRSLLVLDVWGTNHDPRIWLDPYVFDPSRFQQTPVTPFNLIPQGGGDRFHGHRCPGEDVTLGVLTALVPRIAALPYVVVGERPGLRRMPPKPRCRIDVLPVDG